MPEATQAKAKFPALTHVPLYRVTMLHERRGLLVWFGAAPDDVPDLTNPAKLPAGESLYVEKWRLDLQVPNRPRLVNMRASGAADSDEAKRVALRLVVEKDPTEQDTGGLWHMSVEDAAANYCVGAECLFSSVITGTAKPTHPMASVLSQMLGASVAEFTYDPAPGQLSGAGAPDRPQEPRPHRFGDRKTGQG